MDTGKNYEVKDISLAGQGARNMELAELNMGALLEVRKRFSKEKPLSGIRVGLALHVTKETGVLVRTLIAGGADVAITGCNPLSTQDDVAAALAEEGVRVRAYKGETTEDYYRYINNVIDFKPHITIDDGCDLVSEIHKNHAHLVPEIICGCEETTTGIIRLKAMEQAGILKYPMIAVNDNKTKHMVDNYYGTGQSSIDGILRATNLLYAGKTFVACGYGSCGKGVAERAKGLGANVIVTEVDNFRALQAHYDGYRVMKMADAAKIGDVFCTVTGNKHVINIEHMKQMKNGAILANSGHFDNELQLDPLRKAASSVRQVRPFMDEFVIDGKKLFVLGEGRLVNLAAAEGHPSEVMSTSFCGQALACEYGVRNKNKLEARILKLPEELDDQIAGLQLKAMGVEIDEFTQEQKDYLDSWEEGT
ncbi:MAG: adenosylhomocysteinase [Desulfosalsimonas sp.]|uniref:adenosylhomocysteinase n=1 Tax=Desulfosalsimonas sp. TaxID=3073848 RepID=UPI003970641E